MAPYSIKGLAERLNVSLSTATRLIYERRIDSFKVGRLVRVTEEAVQKYLNRNTRPAIPERGAPTGRHHKGVARDVADGGTGRKKTAQPAV